MADSNSEPPRCPCGFWGSAKTLGLCSRCFNEHKKQSSEGNSMSDGRKADLLSQTIDRIKPSVASAHFVDSSSTLESSIDGAASTSTHSAAASVVTASATDVANNAAGASSTETATGTAPTAGVVEEAGQAGKSSKAELLEGEPEPKRYKIEEEDDDLKQPELPPQKNKKRCYKCNIKLELAIREIGRCRCEYVFCQLHRLPEQHGCVFDHKNEGRKAARDKMVSPKKHMGTSLKRIDSDS